MLDKVHRIFSNIRICAHRSLCNRNKRHHQVHHQHCSFKLIVNVLVEHNPVRKSTSSPNSRSISFFLSSWRLFDHASFTITRQTCGILCWWSAKAETITLAWFRHCWYYRTSRTRKSKPFAIGDFLIAVDHLRMTMFKHFQRQQQRNSLVNIRNHAQTRMIIYWTWTQTILSDHFSLIYVFLSFFLLLLLFIFFPIQCVHSTMIKRRDRTTKPKNQATQRVFIYQSRDVFFLFYIQKTKKKRQKKRFKMFSKFDWLDTRDWS